METPHHFPPLKEGNPSTVSWSQSTTSEIVQEVSNADIVDLSPCWQNSAQASVAKRRSRKARKPSQSETFLAQSLTALARVIVTQTDGQRVSNAATAIAGISLGAIQHSASFVAVRGSLSGCGGFGFNASPSCIRVTAYEVTAGGIYRYLGGRGVVFHTGEGRLIESYPADFDAAIRVIRAVVAGGGVHACTGGHLVPCGDHGGSAQTCACIGGGVR